MSADDPADPAGGPSSAGDGGPPAPAPEPDERATGERIGRLLAGGRPAVAFTGAGVSTPSGIPDYRSPGGIWDRYDPQRMTFDRYVVDPRVRRDSWEMRRLVAERDPRPNAAHRALAALERAGLLEAVVTQNVDGLHADAGSRRVVELHGTAREVACIGRPTGMSPAGCGWRAEAEWAEQRIDAGDDDPCCPACGGLVKSATVSFGQAMPLEAMAEAERLAAGCGVLLVAGSSLQVHPAASLPGITVEHGGQVAIVNGEPTPADRLAVEVARGRVDAVLDVAATAALAEVR